MKFLLALGLLMSSSFVQAADPEFSPYGKVFSGNGVQVELVLASQKNKGGLNDGLIRMTGQEAFAAGIDRKVLRVDAEHAGTGVNFTEGSKVRMASRNAWGAWDFFEVYLNGKTIKVHIDKKKTEDFKSDEMIKAAPKA